MPVGPGRFRVKKTKGGRRLRMHFKRGSSEVDEIKDLDTGEILKRPSGAPRSRVFKRKWR